MPDCISTGHNANCVQSQNAFLLGCTGANPLWRAAETSWEPQVRRGWQCWTRKSCSRIVAIRWTPQCWAMGGYWVVGPWHSGYLCCSVNAPVTYSLVPLTQSHLMQKRHRPSRFAQDVLLMQNNILCSVRCFHRIAGVLEVHNLITLCNRGRCD